MPNYSILINYSSSPLPCHNLWTHLLFTAFSSSYILYYLFHFALPLFISPLPMNFFLCILSIHSKRIKNNNRVGSFVVNVHVLLCLSLACVLQSIVCLIPVSLEIYFVPSSYGQKLCIGKIKSIYSKGRALEKHVTKTAFPWSYISFTFSLLTFRFSPPVSIFSSMLIYFPCIYISVSPSGLLIECSTVLQTCILQPERINSLL